MPNIPIDHGWAWMVSLGCFGMFALVIGCLKTEGVFFVEFIETYKTTKSEVAWIAALTGTMMLSMGPIANALCDHFTTRKIVMTGALVSSVGFFTSGYATQVWHLYITFGVLIGGGFGLSYAPSLVVLGQYFKKRRALANGLAGAGCGVGGFIIPYIVRSSIDEYGLQGSFLLMSGLILNLILVGALYRPLSFYVPKSSKTEATAVVENPGGSFIDDSTAAEVLKNRRVLNLQKSSLYRSASHDRVMDGRNVRLLELEVPKLSQSVNNITLEVSSAKNKPSAWNSWSGNLMTSMYGLSVDNLDVGNSNNVEIKEDVVGAVPQWKKIICCLRKQSVSSKSRKIFDWLLMKNSIFLVLLATACCGMGGYPVTMLFIPAHMDDLGFSKQDVVIILSVCSVLDFFGRIAVGWITDHIRVKRYVFSICLLTCGLTTSLMLIFKSFTAIIVCVCFLGFFGGSYMSLNAVVLAEEIGVEALSHSLGICVLFQSLSQLAVNPIAGFIRDSSGSWNGALLLTGLLCICGSLLLFVVPCAQKYEDFRAAVNGNLQKEEARETVDVNTTNHHSPISPPE